MAFQKIPKCQRAQQNPKVHGQAYNGCCKTNCSDELILIAGSMLLVSLQMTSTNALEFQSSKWTRFSTATTVTIGTLTMALTCLLCLVSAFCWASFK